jgi:N-methylhydantoinase B
MRVLAGERFACVGPAGGGYGDPLRRDPALVREDVADGFVSAEAARNDYGVVLTPSGNIDDAATARLRDEMATTPDHATARDPEAAAPG